MTKLFDSDDSEYEGIDTGYPHDREIDIQMLKMFRNGYILSW